MDLSAKQQNLINRVAAENGLSDFQIIKTPGSIKGDNFLGILTAITLTNDKKTLELILKSAPNNDAVHGLYDREIYMYTKLFKEFSKFQEENNIAKPFNCTPKLYEYSIDDKEKCLLMENLTKVGYQLWNKKNPMNSDHVTSVLLEYAKFHAVSFAMKKKKPNLFADLSNPIYKTVFDNLGFTSDEEKLNAYVNARMENAYKAMADDPVLTACVTRIDKKIRDFLKNELQKEEHKIVLNHGDCWCNNFLFKYQESNNATNVSSIRILDWQLACLSSPAYDICYFLCVNGSKIVLENYQTYLRLYYEALSTQLRDFGCDPEEIFPYSLLEVHVKKFMVFGAYFSILLFKLMISDPEEAPNFAENLGRDSFLNQMGSEIKNTHGYKERLGTMLKVLDDNNLV